MIFKPAVTHFSQVHNLSVYQISAVLPQSNLWLKYWHSFATVKTLNHSVLHETSQLNEYNLPRQAECFIESVSDNSWKSYLQLMATPESFCVLLFLLFLFFFCNCDNKQSNFINFWLDEFPSQCFQIHYYLRTLTILYLGWQSLCVYRKHILPTLLSSNSRCYTFLS